MADIREALEAACLEGLIDTPHGWRYRPSKGADAVEAVLADVWDAGYDRGFSDGYNDVGDWRAELNPYRATAKAAGVTHGQHDTTGHDTLAAAGED